MGVTGLKAVICPPEHKHGVNGTCYAHHKCRCEGCVATARAREDKRRKPRMFKDRITDRLESCYRCGIETYNESRICGDCVYVMTDEEYLVWRTT